MLPGDWPVHLIPLGGLGEIGMNAMLVRQGDDYLMLDCGVRFPDATTVGVEHLMPNLDVLAGLKGRVRGVVLSHGHEDHVGALRWVLPLLDAPVYGTAFTLGLVHKRLSEHGLAERVPFHEVAPGDQVQLGPFDLSFLRVTHSIPDCVAFVLRTAAGTIVHTGDFKIEADPADGVAFDVEGFRATGDRGVHLLLSDSTNAMLAGRTGSELKVGERLAEHVRSWPGRVVVTLFASNLYRLSTLWRVARETGRQLCVAGRSMDTYLEVGRATTSLPLPGEGEVLDISEADSLPMDRVLVACTGSQAEPRSVLVRVGKGEHSGLRVGAADLVIFSSRVIPGNERPIYRLVNDLMRLGARCVLPHAGNGVHASGHAKREELSEVISLLRPRHFVPVHGEYAFLRAHADLAAELGVEDVHVVEDGAVLGVAGDDVAEISRVEAEPFYNDGARVGTAEALHLAEKTRLAWNGVVVARLARGKPRGGRRLRLSLESSGLVTDDGALLDAAVGFVEGCLEDLPPGMSEDALRGEVRILVRRFFRKELGRKPTVFVVPVSAQ